MNSKPLIFLFWNFFLALLLWKGFEGNKTAQYIFAGLNWFGVINMVISFCHFKTTKEAIDIKPTSFWLSVPVTVGFIVTLVWHGWIWTSVAVALELILISEYVNVYKKKLD